MKTLLSLQDSCLSMIMYIELIEDIHIDSSKKGVQEQNLLSQYGVPSERLALSNSVSLPPAIVTGNNKQYLFSVTKTPLSYHPSSYLTASSNLTSSEILTIHAYQVNERNVFNEPHIVRHDVSNLDDTINIEIPGSYQTVVNETEKAFCVYFDSNSQWSTMGCSLTETSASSIMCSCNHLSDFAVTNEVILPFQLPLWAWMAFIVLAALLLCCIISILLTCTICILCHCTRKRQRQREAKQKIVQEFYVLKELMAVEIVQAIDVDYNKAKNDDDDVESDLSSAVSTMSLSSGGPSEDMSRYFDTNITDQSDEDEYFDDDLVQEDFVHPIDEEMENIEAYRFIEDAPSSTTSSRMRQFFSPASANPIHPNQVKLRKTDSFLSLSPSPTPSLPGSVQPIKKTMTPMRVREAIRRMAKKTDDELESNLSDDSSSTQQSYSPSPTLLASSKLMKPKPPQDDNSELEHHQESDSSGPFLARLRRYRVSKHASN
eukprot:CAMPEP_0117423064 /NCGR_PEP_ID=MMETSP0758-20121206/3777_1 /TAXON_ID=63605 /ORGANISM="Percolomonas cosmopolitus, Strain AE-1 (ATCC 50343)" /LENGTH=487 /DNA_ID=CAMNT_0005206057 /DNA_START=3923 /DNA_END=5386 /DNA_ORIENTATION=+